MRFWSEPHRPPHDHVYDVHRGARDHSCRIISAIAMMMAMLGRSPVVCAPASPRCVCPARPIQRMGDRRGPGNQHPRSAVAPLHPKPN
jgi:hypothetical protein